MNPFNKKVYTPKMTLGLLYNKKKEKRKRKKVIVS